MTEKTLCERCGEWVDLHGNHCCDDRQKLIERLRAYSSMADHLSRRSDNERAAADHIEELVKEKTALNHLCNAIFNRHIKEINELEAKLTKAVEVGVDVAASLNAATSLLERGGKRAAASDKMFDQMLMDYNASLDRFRATLAEIKGGNDAESNL